MDLYNLDIEDVRLLLTLVKDRAEHLRVSSKTSFQEKEAGRLASLQKRFGDEILYATRYATRGPHRPVDDIAGLVREYFEALDGVREIGPARMLNLKGAARTAVIRKRKARLAEAEAVLRALIG